MTTPGPPAPSRCHCQTRPVPYLGLSEALFKIWLTVRHAADSESGPGPGPGARRGGRTPGAHFNASVPVALWHCQFKLHEQVAVHIRLNLNQLPVRGAGRRRRDIG